VVEEGSHLRWDNLISVLYAEELNSTKSSVLFRGQTDMGFWTKSLRIFNSLCDNAKQSIRQVAHQTEFSKSSVHRLKQVMERRDTHPESWWWETEEGRC
jgi:hypothetical protein